MYQRNWAKHLDTTPEHLNSMKINMVLIPPGEFSMAAAASPDRGVGTAHRSQRREAGENAGRRLSERTRNTV